MRGRLNFRHLSLNAQFKQATFVKQNAWSNKVWGSRELHPRSHRFRWHGPVFWPYFFGDYFCYALWPDDCDDIFWGYGPDVVEWGTFWPYGETGYDDEAAYLAADAGRIYVPSRTAASAAGKGSEAFAEICTGFAPGVSELPTQKLEGIIYATNEQRTALEDLKAAAARASDILKKACPSEPPLTPLARLDTMQGRLKAMEQANATVKGPFLRLYGLLTDEQKRRLAAASKPSSPEKPARSKTMSVAELCRSQAKFTRVPADQILRTIELTHEQQVHLNKLRAASAKASEELKTSCPPATLRTIEARLDAAQQRLEALIAAIDTLRPAIRDFYASLTDEQKARLNLQQAVASR
jgi:LTXXQ motif family protein